MIRILLFLLLLGPLLGWTQNALFLPFGQSKGEVHAHLASKNPVSPLANPPTDSLVHQLENGWSVAYLMEEEQLYAVEDIREYTDKKEVEAVITSCLAYFKLFDKRIREPRKNGLKAYYVVVLDDRLVELRVWESGKRKQRRTHISLRSTSRLYGPRLKTESMIAQLDS